VKTALAAGADTIVLCDTNGGSMPYGNQLHREKKFLLPSL